jgi:6-pyruvoyltetrahydropterin/6-carboxytetrahydropterin synthase
VRLRREYCFEAAHRLPLVPEGHKCARLHGHSYRVEIHVEGPVGEDGMVVDFAVLDEFWVPLQEVLDHRLLNDVKGLENPTSENLAIWIWEHLHLPWLRRVVVSETPRSSVEYERR